MFSKTKKLQEENTLLKEERNELKEMLKEKEAELEGLHHVFYEMSMGFVVFSIIAGEEDHIKDLTIRYANKELTQYVKKEAKSGESITTILPTFSKEIIEVCEEIRKQGNQNAFIEYDDQEKIYIKIMCYMVNEEECACILSDVTESYLAQKLVGDSEMRFQTLSMITSEIIFELDEEGRFTYINDGIRTVLGYEPEEFIGKHFYEQYPPTIRAQGEFPISGDYNKLDVVIKNRMTELLDKNGKVHWALQNGLTLTEEDGTVTGYLGVYLDVTELQKEKLKAESAMRVKEDFLAKMSHEIRTPLNGIIGLTSLALDEPRSYKIYNYLEKMEESALDLLDIINAILDYSKITEDGIKLYEEPFSLKLVIKKVTSLLRLKAEEKNIKLMVEVEEVLHDTYMGDGIRLGQILTNLLSNGVKYTLEGSVKLIVRKRDKGLLFIVKDTGIGMKEEFLEHIFDPFSQEGDLRTRGQNGTGLGMVIAKQLIDVMGGKIKVISKENVGTKVYCALPLVPCDKELVRTNENEYFKMNHVHQYRGNVLVVEDNSINQMVVCDLLEKFHVQVTVAKEGKTAVELAAKNHYDLIFMDLFMPTQSGFETCKKMHQMRIKTPIIAMTANPFENIKVEYADAKMDGFLTKPIHINKIEYFLKKYLPDEQAIHEMISATKEEQPEIVMHYPFDHVYYEESLHELEDNISLYNKIVFQFIKEYQNKIPKIYDLIHNDKKNAILYMHTLKGVAKTLGALELCELATNVEEMVRGTEVDEKLVAKLTSELQIVLKELMPYAESIKMKPYEYGFDNVRAESFVIKLEHLLSKHNAQAVERVRDIYEVLYREDLAQKVELLVSQIEHYEFEHAKQTLRAISNRLSSTKKITT